ncbi:MAG TPA: hypothetical protein VOA80_00680 [Thermoanaerobaculia bacterium]|nr:hypothetical protein [Thermoanaerobaculia bacterium]
MPEVALALVTRSDPNPAGKSTLAFQVAGEVLTEKDFAEKYRIVSVGGLSPWTEHTNHVGVGQQVEHRLVDQAVGLVLIEPVPASGATWGR